MNRKLFLIPLVALALGLSSCGGEEVVEQKAPDYPVKTLDTVTTTVYWEHSGAIASKLEIEIRPRVSGYLRVKYIKDGQHVTKGQPLFKIEDTDYQQAVNAAAASVEAARAAVANADLEVRKLTPLVEKGIISPFQLQTAKSNLESANAQLRYAQAQLENANINLNYTTIVAPEDGRLGAVPYDIGTLVSSAMQYPLTMLYADGDAYFEFSIDEKNLITEGANGLNENMFAKEKGSRIELILAGGQKYPYKGYMEMRSAGIDRATGTLAVRVVFPNKEGVLMSGASAVAKFPYVMSGVILIPQSATFEIQDKTIAYVLNDDNTVVRKVVNVLGPVGENYAITGIEKGTTIVVEGVSRLQEGMTINPIKK